MKRKREGERGGRWESREEGRGGTIVCENVSLRVSVGVYVNHLCKEIK